MMKIEFLSGKPDRADRYTVRFADGTSLRLYRQTVENFGLYSGMELSSEEYKRLTDAAGLMSAKMRAVRILSAANVSQKDLESRLIHKGEKPSDARQAVQWMSDMDLLDDLQTAKQIVSRCVAKGYGPARAKQALYEKQIPREFWDEVLENYPDQQEAIVKFLSSRLGKCPDQMDIKRTVDALLRRGHSYGAVRQAVNAFLEDSEYLED